MTEQNDNKKQLDMIASLQIKLHQKDNKKEEDKSDDDWIEYSDDDDYDQTNTNTSKSNNIAKVVAKDDNKAKKFSNLKDYLGNGENRSNGQNKNRKKHGGNFYNDSNNRGDKKEFSKPVFSNSLRHEMNNDDRGARGNNDYSSRKYNYNNDRDYNKYDKRPQFNNSNKYFQNQPLTYQAPPKTNPNDEKENVMKSIHTIGSLVKNLNEENKNIKAPLKNYTDIDITKPDFRKERNHHYEKKQERPVREEREKESNRDGLQRPTFTNSALENKQNNFRELDHQGDLYMKKLQQSNVELNPNEYFKEKEGFKYQKRVGDKNQNHYKNTENIEENLVAGNEEHLEDFETYNEKEYQDDQAYNNRYDSGYNKKRKFNKNYDNEHFWDMATNNNFNSGENDYYNDYEKPIQKEEKRNSIKPKKIITKKEKETKPVEEPKKQEDVKDKVVFAVQNAKSIKDIFG